jgi:hypothetical protein
VRTFQALEELTEPAGNAPPELVIDVANVCRNPSLVESEGVARWDRLLAIVDAWNRWEYGFDRPVVQLIADSSLLSALPPDDRRLLRTAETDGYAHILEYADPTILDLAEQHDCSVLTNDQFVGHRRERPWLDGNDDRFVQFDGANGELQLRLAVLSQRTSYSMSRAEERDELKSRHIDPSRHHESHLLNSVYRCDDLDCLRRSFAPEGAIPPPARGRSGGAVCTSCGNALTLVGTRRDTAVIKLSAEDGRDPVRVPLPADNKLVIGRASPDLSLKSVLVPAQLKRISRSHAALSFGQGRVFVEDLGSSNGSTFEAWDREGKRWAPGVPLGVDSPRQLGPRDRITLGGVLSVERSGRRYPFDLGNPERSGQPPVSARTVLADAEEY